MLLCILGLLFSAWILFFGGAEKLEKSVLGYIEFGQLADRALYIKILAWAGMVFFSIAIFVGVTAS